MAHDAVKGFVVHHEQRLLLDYSCLKIFIPEPDYLLAMKTLSARVEGTDKEDVKFLINVLKLKTPTEVFKILENYYPQTVSKPATRFFIEELFGE